MAYERSFHSSGLRRSFKPFLLFFLIFLVVVAGVVAYFLIQSEPTIEELVSENVIFDDSVTAEEQAQIRQMIIDAQIRITNPINISAEINDTVQNDQMLLNEFVPVTDAYSVQQRISTADLTSSNTFISASADTSLSAALAKQLGVADDMQTKDVTADTLSDEIVFVSPTELNQDVKLLTFNDGYYLDNFTRGGLYREMVIEGDNIGLLNSLSFGTEQLSREDVFTTNITGVTALTRVMMRKLAEVNDPLYFSANIGEFLGAADLTHVSNEVSFRDDCEYSNTLFCSPPEFIETLKASGVDLVEITGNHNNDFGSAFNTSTIELYDSLGWGVVGGGLNLEDGRQPFISSTKGSDLAFLAYNYPDAPNGGAIAGVSTAGANPFDFSYTNIQEDITAAQEQSDFVIVNIQYWECYAYPDGYLEYPECDVPIDEQEAVFKQVADLGADMVVGTSAHQPQTYEIYNGVPIYYGLGNLYFDQTSWPGTERGIVLTNYFVGGELLQTKFTGTVYDEALQTRVMTPDEENFLLTRLQVARN